MASINLNVEGITCGGCEKSIRNALLENNGVSEATASHAGLMGDSSSSSSSNIECLTFKLHPFCMQSASMPELSVLTF